MGHQQAQPSPTGVPLPFTPRVHPLHCFGTWQRPLANQFPRAGLPGTGTDYPGSTAPPRQLEQLERYPAPPNMPLYDTPFSESFHQAQNWAVAPGPMPGTLNMGLDLAPVPVDSTPYPAMFPAGHYTMMPPSDGSFQP